jgi:large repetitive protein
MARLRRALFLVSLLLSVSMFAQSADQELLSATDSPDPVIPGNDITYTIQMRNNGPDPAVNGGLNANISGSLALVSASGPAGFTCFSLGNNLSCTNPSWAAGTTATFTVVANVPASLLAFPDGSVTSNFFSSGVTPDPNNGNQSASVTTNYDSPQVDLSLSVTDSPDPVFIDGTITYTVDVANNGPDTATNVNFNVVPNSTLAFQSVSAPAGWNCVPPAVGALNATFTCSRASWAPGTGQFIIQLSANDENIGILDTTLNTFFGINAGASNETNNGNNQETESTQYSTADADMNITATDSPDPVVPDGDITYTVTVTNQGPDTATNAKMAIIGNGGQTRFVSLSAPGGWSCSPPAPGTLLNVAGYDCTIASFANGASAVFTVVTEASDDLHPNSDHNITQAFTTSAAQADPDNTDNGITVTTAYDVPNADIAVTNSDSPDPVSPGDTITYTQTITNNGPDTATNATIAQNLPSNVTFQSITEPPGFNCTTPAVGTTGTVTCVNPSMANGASASFTLVVQVIANPGNSVIDTVVGSSDASDVDLSDNSVTVSTTVLIPVVADLGITKTTNSDGAAAGSTIAYTITLTNNGPDAAANVVMNDTLPSELLFQSISVPAGFNCTTPAVGATGAIHCTAATMANGTTAIFTLIVQLTSNAVGPINNNATATSDTDDNNGGNDGGSAPSVPVTPGNTADLAVTKSTPTTTAAPGDTVTYTISVTNNGPGVANDVIVSDALPASLRFQSITPAATFTCTTPAVGANGTVTCIGGPLANAATATFTLVTTIAPSASGSFMNTAVASTSDTDPVSSNSTDASDPIVIASADVSIVKTTNATQAPSGSTITYTITVTNNGPDTATNVVVSDNLPSGLQYVSAVPSQGSCAGTDPFTCSLGTLLNGASATITLQALVTASSGTVTNTATVTADTDDGAPGNNSSTSPATPVTPGSAQEAAIPTLSEWAMLALATMLGLIAVAKMRM